MIISKTKKIIAFNITLILLGIINTIGWSYLSYLFVGSFL